jgi:ribosomal protein S18 acetylase RimI-like enzyme
MTEPALRVWTVGDIETVRMIARETWKATYGAFIPDADLTEYLETRYAVEALTNTIADPLFRGFLASWEDHDAGYMIVSTPSKEDRCYVSSVYVLPAYQGKGIGRAFMAEARRYAQRRGFDRIWLGVMTANTAARAWYERNGFRFVKKEPFTMGTTTVEHLIGYQDFT